MKALILNAMGSTDEAFTLAKVALRNAVRSHVCWHVYGLLWRSQKNYEEATKAYRMALTLDPDSPQILRDLALLQVQTRDYAGYAQSRNKMLTARNNFRQNWTALAIAHHLNGDLVQAEKVLDLFENSLTQKPPKQDIEHNEALMYKNTIIAESGDTQRALEHLDLISENTLDKTSLMEMRALYLLQLGRSGDAEAAYRALLARNSELRAYYDGLEKALNIDSSDKQARKKLYESFADKDERLDAARRIPLDFLEGDDFNKAADSYLRRVLKKGVPSTFNNVKSLYGVPEKRQTIQELVESYKSEKLHTNGDAAAAAAATDEEAAKEQEAAASRWEQSVLYFLAQHYNYKLTRDLTKAMAYTDQLIELSPKRYDWSMNKARIHKHMGHLNLAAEWMEKARALDPRDRYINTKTAKYQQRNNANDAALDTMSKFTRNEVLGGTLGDLIEMQQVGYLTEDAEAWARQSQLGLALKRFTTVIDMFDTWHEDQFDFHSFSLRKAQIRAYVDLMRWEDGLRSHPAYVRCVVGAARIYLHLHDDPALVKSSDMPVGATRHTDKDTVRRLRIDEAKRLEAQAERDRKAAAKKANVGQDGEQKKTDADPRGRALVEAAAPLDIAAKLLAPAVQPASWSLQLQLLAADVHIRRGKWYLALRSLLAARALSPKSASLVPTSLHFRLAVDAAGVNDAALHKLVASSLPAPFDKPLGSGRDAAVAAARTANDALLSPHARSVPHATAHIRAARLIALVAGAAQSTANVDVVRAAAQASKAGDVKLEDAVDALRAALESGDADVKGREELARMLETAVGFGGEVLEREARR